MLGRRVLEARFGRTQVVVVEGRAGLGKTALLTEFVAREAATVSVTWVRCDQFEQDIAFAAAEVLLGRTVDPGSSELEVGRRLLAHLGDGERDGGVTVLAVDDAHWMDGPSARALRFALRRLRVEPLLAVVARRPGSPDTDIFTTEDPRDTTVLLLDPLERQAVDELALRTRGWALAPRTTDLVVEKTGGSPLLIASVLQNATDQTQLDTWTGVPATAATAVARMLGSVDEETRGVVEAVAVLADGADLVTVGGVADQAAAAAQVTAAAAAGLLTVDHGGVVWAAHALLREAVYDALPLNRRQRLHGRAAEWTAGDRRLGHLAAAAGRADPDLVTELVAAADAARATRRYSLAATHRLRARSVCAEPVERDVLLCEALLDRVSAQDLDGADELAGQAADLRPSALRSLALGLLARERGRIGAGRTFLQEALTWAADDSDVRVRARAAVEAAWLHVRLGDGESALAVLETVADLVDDLGDPELAGDARTTRAIALWHTGRGGEALALLQTVALSPHGTPWEPELLSTRGTLHLYAGDLTEAAADQDRLIAMSHLWRPSANQAVMYVQRCLTRQHRGDWDGALADAAAARALATQAEAWTVVWSSAASVHVPAHRGQWDIATEHLDTARAALDELSYALADDLVSRAECAFHTARGDHAALLGLLEPLLTDDHLERFATFRSYRWILPAWISSCVHVGRLADAEEELRRYRGLLERWPGGPDVDRVGWLHGLLAAARGNLDAARAHFGADLNDPRTPTNPFVHGQLRQTVGRLELAAGRRREAVRHLMVAHDLYAGLGAVPWVGRCRHDLEASGMRSTSTDPRALTAREEDVAALVSRGYTNKEAARELFVSAKAVEYHLRGIYAKLGITNRGELRRRRAIARPSFGDQPPSQLTR